MRNHPSNYFHARRRRNAERLVRYLAFHGRKVYLTADQHADIQDETALDRYAVDQVLNDLYELGNIDRREAGEIEVIELLSEDLDEAAKHTPTVASKKPRFVLAASRNGASHED